MKKYKNDDKVHILAAKMLPVTFFQTRRDKSLQIVEIRIPVECIYLIAKKFNTLIGCKEVIVLFCRGFATLLQIQSVRFILFGLLPIIHHLQHLGSLLNS